MNAKKTTKKVTKKSTKKVGDSKESTTTKKAVKEKRVYKESGTMRFDDYNKIFNKMGFTLIEHIETYDKGSSTPVANIECAVYSHPDFQKYNIDKDLEPVVVFEYHKRNLMGLRSSLAVRDKKGGFWFYLSPQFSSVVRKDTISVKRILDQVKETVGYIKDFTGLIKSYQSRKLKGKERDFLVRSIFMRRVRQLKFAISHVNWEKTDPYQVIKENVFWRDHEGATLFNLMASISSNMFHSEYGRVFDITYFDKKGEEYRGSLNSQIGYKVQSILKKDLSVIFDEFYRKVPSSIALELDASPVKVPVKKKKVEKAEKDFKISF